VRRLELLLVAFWLACWAVSLLSVAGLQDLSGRLDLPYYPYFAIAAFAGWLFGNVWVERCRRVPGTLRRSFWVLYFFGPPGFLYLLWTMQPAARQRDPTGALLSFAVFAALFLVPVLLRRTAIERPHIRRSTPSEPRPGSDPVEHQNARPDSADRKIVGE
jgi:hypothetical protein